MEIKNEKLDKSLLPPGFKQLNKVRENSLNLFYKTVNGRVGDSSHFDHTIRRKEKWFSSSWRR